MSAPVSLASTASFKSGKSYAFAAGTTFVQAFKVQASGVPNALVVYMGANQNPFAARVQLKRGEEVLFDHAFDQRRQRRSDLGTVFELEGLSARLEEGEWASFEVTPSMEIGIEPLLIDSPDFRKAALSGYGDIVARFSLEGAAEAPADAGRGLIEIAAHRAAASGKFELQNLQDGTGSPGELVISQAPNERDYVVIRADWRFAPNTLLSAYQQTNELGRMVPLPRDIPGPKQVRSYAQTAGDVYFDVDISYENRQGRPGQLSKYGYVRCRAPQVVGITTMQTVGPWQGRIPRIGLGDPFNGVLGIALNFEVTAVPGLPGKIAVLQVMRGYRRYTRGNGTIVSADTGGAWYLDNVRGYPAGDLAYGGEETHTAPNGPATLTVNDSPGTGLHDDCIRLEVNEDFRSHLCIKADGPENVWMSLGHVDWSWSTTVSRPNVNAAWAVTAAAPAAPSTPVFIRDGAQPTWTGNTRSLIAILDQAFGPEPPPPMFIRLLAGGACIVALVQGSLTLDQQSRATDMTGSPVSPTGGNGMVVWATPDALARLRGIPGVTTVGERPIDQRIVIPIQKTQRHRDLWAQVTRFICHVAPQCLFGPGADEQTLENLCPRRIEEVGADLVELARRAGIGMTAQWRGLRALDLEFASHPSDAQLRALAASQYVYMVEPRPDFSFDDPTDEPELE
ncbi:hypothetical protein [Phenylobacterium sp.]|uniref:hypothetical protein n=1 Tax=Phenylobacterium sp. TaxID=1871053 RepID=UPI002DF0BE1F|nr:hypothetical protein [Phenylobacterium sp.]